ncbi:hypothetical protein M5K25_000342 [Dendrobium thyrsiflorum]|uniref:Uncharacterized protein n=1 Tax=Dendrobium thyrsiflorum TaxID=117978 RepID=A0ABD0VVD5_DENTH
MGMHRYMEIYFYENDILFNVTTSPVYYNIIHFVGAYGQLLNPHQHKVLLNSIKPSDHIKDVQFLFGALDNIFDEIREHLVAQVLKLMRKISNKKNTTAYCNKIYHCSFDFTKHVEGEASSRGQVHFNTVVDTLTVHPNHSKNTPDLSLIYWPCHSQKTINRPLISHKRGPKARGEEEKKRRGEGGDSSSTVAGVPPDRHLTSEFRLTAT